MSGLEVTWYAGSRSWYSAAQYQNSSIVKVIVPAPRRSIVDQPPPNGRRLALGRDLMNGGAGFLLHRLLKGRAIMDMTLLGGGFSNLSLRFHIDGEASAMVLRIYLSDPDAQAREVAIISRLARRAPVPELVDFGMSADGRSPYSVYRFVHGITFQELKAAGSATDCAQAAFAAGQALFRLQALAATDLAALPLASISLGEITQRGFEILRVRLGDHCFSKVQRFLAARRDMIAALNAERALVHGDFHSRNVIFERESGVWAVAGVIDWEDAGLGSPLWDAARFVCDDGPSRPLLEPFFSNGYRAAGGSLPPEWNVFAADIARASAAQALSREDLRERFVPALKELVVNI